jgi:transposase
MNPYPGENSVLVIDNAKIHHDEEMIDLIERIGCRVLFLPPYSPDYNPIELAFSTIKAWFKKNRDFMEICSDSEYCIMIACSQVTPELAKSYFKKSLGFDF